MSRKSRIPVTWTILPVMVAMKASTYKYSCDISSCKFGSDVWSGMCKLDVHIDNGNTTCSYVQCPFWNPHPGTSVSLWLNVFCHNAMRHRFRLFKSGTVVFEKARLRLELAPVSTELIRSHIFTHFLLREGAVGFQAFHDMDIPDDRTVQFAKRPVLSSRSLDRCIRWYLVQDNQNQ